MDPLFRLANNVLTYYALYYLLSLSRGRLVFRNNVEILDYLFNTYQKVAFIQIIGYLLFNTIGIIPFLLVLCYKIYRYEIGFALFWCLFDILLIYNCDITDYVLYSTYYYIMSTIISTF